jgi:hypothetical protein
MSVETIEMLADAIKEYYSNYELDDLSSQFGVDIEYQGTNPDYMRLAKTLTTNTGGQSTQRFFKALLPDLLKRCNERIANSTSEDLIYHQQMLHQIEGFQLLLREPKAETEIKTPGSYIFSVKSEVQTFLRAANTDLIIVDPWIGIDTLDCFVGIKSKIRLLTGKSPKSFESGLEAMLKRYRAKFSNVSIRRYKPLQDRFIVFNDKCWLTGTSLKDAGKAALNLIEIKDNKPIILKEIARKWSEAEDFLSADAGKRVTQKPPPMSLDQEVKKNDTPEKKRSSLFGLLKKK